MGVILSTIAFCGLSPCDAPGGALLRKASYADSINREYARVKGKRTPVPAWPRIWRWGAAMRARGVLDWVMMNWELLYTGEGKRAKTRKRAAT